MNTTKKILNWIVAVLKGTLVGLAIVIPGVSGGSMLLTIGVYEDAVSITSKDKARRRAAIKKLIPYAVGIVLGVVALSFVVTWLLSNFEFFTILLFSGLILGSLPMLFKKIKGHKVKFGYIVVALVMIALMVLLPYLNDNTSESFKKLSAADTLSVGERVVLTEGNEDTLTVQNGDAGVSVWEIKSAGGTFGKPSDGYKLRSGADKKTFMQLSGGTVLPVDQDHASVLDLTMNADGTLTLSVRDSGETMTSPVYRAVDALNNGFWSAMLALLLGFIAAGTMIVPGISGSMVMLVLGYYYSVMTHLKSAVVCLLTLNFAKMGPHLLVLVPFGIGILLGLLIVSKVIRWLLDKHPTPTYYGIIALMLASPYAIFLKAKCFGPAFGASLAQWWFIPVAVLCLALGFVVSFFMSKKEA
jgi:putative membrane protein